MTPVSIEIDKVTEIYEMIEMLAEDSILLKRDYEFSYHPVSYTNTTKRVVFEFVEERMATLFLLRY